MKRIVNAGAFEALDNREMMEIDGGRPRDYDFGYQVGQIAKAAYNAAVDTLTKAYNYASNAVSNAWNWAKNQF